MSTADQPLAVIDVGSNSGRVLVTQLDGAGGLEVLEEVQAPLRLIRSVGEQGRLSAEAIDHTVRVLSDFKAIAEGVGAQRFLAVATAAVREAENRMDLVERVRESLGLEIEIIDGGREAQLAFVGAVHNLPVEHGLLIDVGGGSLQIVHFRDRYLIRSWTFPLGALRLSDRFFLSDPPLETELETLRGHVRQVIREAGLPRLATGEHLIATGGTARNLARIDREAHKYPIPRVHGYTLSAARLDDVVNLMAGKKVAGRAKIRGLQSDRADSIIGGALVVQMLMEQVGATELQVSGQGLREGLAHTLLADRFPSGPEVRAASIAAFVERFATWNRAVADRRVQVASVLLEAALPGASPELCETVHYAARVIDVGRSVDYYRRHQHAEAMIISADLAGFSHRELAMLAATVGLVAVRKLRLKVYRPLLDRQDRPLIAFTSAVVALAEEAERRCPRSLPLDAVARREGDVIRLELPTYRGGDLEALVKQFRKATGYQLDPPSPTLAGGAESIERSTDE